MMYIDQLIRLLDVIIWPLTLLIILSWFKSELQGFFKNLKKIQAGADGVSFESFERQFSKTRELFPASTLSKSSTTKSPQEVTFKLNSNLSPSQQIRNWHDELSDITTSGTSSNPEEALEQLRASGRIRLEEYQKRKNLLQLTGMTTGQLSKNELIEIQSYLNNLEL